MESEVVKDNDMMIRAAEFIEQAATDIYNNYPHEVKAILFAAASILFGYGTYKEIHSISK